MGSETVLMNKKSITITNLFLVVMLSVAVVSIIVIGSFWISNVYSRFNREAQILRQELTEEHKSHIRNQVESAVDYIEFRRSKTEAQLKTSLKQRVYEVTAIAHHIYEKNKDLMPVEQVKSKIKEALRPIRFNDGRGYYFIVSLDGIEILYPVAPQFENKNLLDLQDAKGNYVIRDEIELVKRQGEGYIKDYWRKPNDPSGMVHPKMTFVKLFEPYHWYLGTGEYLNDFEEEVRDDVLDRLARIRFGKEGYIFVNDYDGNQIITDGKRVKNPKNLWSLTDPNGVKVIQEERRAVENPDGDFIYYTWKKLTEASPAPKVSFIKGIPEWRWMLGAGVYLDEVEAVVAQKKIELQDNVRKQIIKILIILISLVFFVVLTAKLISERIKKGFEVFSHFFNKAAAHSILIEPSQLTFTEFKSLAGSANRMITDLKGIEEEKLQLQEKLSRSKKMEALGLLTGGVAHDLNNILSGMVSYPDLILRDLDQDDKIRKPLTVIKESGQRAAAVVADLLTASRGVREKPEVTAMNHFVETYLASPEHDELGQRYPYVQFHSHLESGMSNVRCAPVQIGKAVMNLVANAAEAIDESGEVHIKTETRHLEHVMVGYENIPPGKYGVIEVSDTGPGITQEDLTRIFEPFFTKKVLGRSGTGLGLSLVWNAVHDSNGFIDVKTSHDGTVFELFLPATDELSAPLPQENAMENYMGKGQRVLVVDDERVQREIATDILERLGYSVVALSSGEEAITYLKQDEAELVVLDMIMDPGMGGLDTYAAILARNPDQKAIVVTGYAETDDMQEMLDMGASCCVRKPYTFEELGMAVHKELA